MVIFDGKDVVVLRRTDFPSDTLVVSFSPRSGAGGYIESPGVELVGAGEAFFAKRSMPAVFFVARWNHWYQSREMPEAIEALRQAGLFEDYSKIVAYGLSMGGYGALMYSKAINATRVLAVAPQYSIDNSKVPEERRWPHDRKTLQFINDDMDQGLIQDGEVAVMYDPLFRIDRIHADHVASHRKIVAIALPLASHTIGRSLDDVGIFSSTIEQFLRSGSTSFDVRAKYKELRRQSPTYLINLARMQNRRKRSEHAIALAQEAISILSARVEAQPGLLDSPEKSIIYSRHVVYLFDILMRYSRNQEAYDVADYWSNYFPSYRQKFGLSKVLAKCASGEIEIAKQIYEEVMRGARRLNADNATLLVRAVEGFGGRPDLFAAHRQFGQVIQSDATASFYFGEALERVGLPDMAATYLALAPSALMRRREKRSVRAAPRAHHDAREDLLDLPSQEERVQAPSLATGARGLIDQIKHLEADPSEEALLKLDDEARSEMLAHEVIAVRFGNLLLRCGLKSRAEVYFRDAPVGPSRSREALNRRRIAGMESCAGAAAAKALAAVLADDGRGRETVLELSEAAAPRAPRQK